MTKPDYEAKYHALVIKHLALKRRLWVITEIAEAFRQQLIQIKTSIKIF